MCTASVATYSTHKVCVLPGPVGCARDVDRCAVAGTVKALLPVGNRPLISYPLRNLAEAGIKNCIVVRDAAAAATSQQ
jgi:hypothetical protein